MPEPALKIEAIRPRRLYQQVAEQIERMIDGGAYKPGGRLPSEMELSKQFAVSRPTIREAMIVLETAGLIDVQNGNGTFVRDLGDKLRPLTQRANDPGPGPYEQFEARELIECEVAALAAERISADGISELEKLVDQMALNYPLHPLADPEGLQFHVALARASGNSVFAAIVEELWGMRFNKMWTTLRARLLTAEDRQRAIAWRREILAALQQRDPDAARDTMRRMLTYAKAMYFGEKPG